MSRRRSPEREPQGRSRDGVNHRRVLGASHEVARPGVAETLFCELRCGAGAVEEDVHECGTDPAATASLMHALLENRPKIQAKSTTCCLNRY